MAIIITLCQWGGFGLSLLNGLCWELLCKKCTAGALNSRAQKALYLFINNVHIWSLNTASEMKFLYLIRPESRWHPRVLLQCASAVVVALRVSLMMHQRLLKATDGWRKRWLLLLLLSSPDHLLMMQLLHARAAAVVGLHLQRAGLLLMMLRRVWRRHG